MAELHTNLYFKHPNSDVQQHLVALFKTINDTPSPDFDNLLSDLRSNASAITPDAGEMRVDALLQAVKEAYGETHDLVAESRYDIAGYHGMHFVHGSSGDDIMGGIVQFIGDIAPETDVRACLAGDDDPWEIFYRYENGRVVMKAYEPDYEEAEEEELPDVYQWWHAGLPQDIKDGFINDWLEEGDED